MADYTRRDFLKTGAKGAFLVTVPAVFRLNPLIAAALENPEINTLSDYLDHFMVDEALINKVMATALSRGGDYCDLYFQHSISNNIRLEDNIVSRASSNIDFGVGIRVLNGDQVGYSFTEEISPEAMSEAALTAANIATSGGIKEPAELSAWTIPSFYEVETRWDQIGVGRKLPVLQRINELLYAGDSRIIKAAVTFTDDNKYILIAGSDGRLVHDYQPMTRIFADCTAEDNGRRESNSVRKGGRFDISYYSEEKIKEVSDEAVARTIDLFEAVKPGSGEMEVVLAAGTSGILLHEAIGHGMEADFNRKNESIFSDKIGKKVAENFVTIVDDGTVPHARGSINVDDEGNVTEKTYLVRDGILRSYLHDKISAEYYGVKPTGNGRRQSFRYSPIPRMRNTYMENGPHEKEEIIQSVKNGLYAETFTNGEVNIGPGDFTFYVKSGRIIKDGKLDRPVKDINIIGNGPDVLRKIVMVANDSYVIEGGGTCGKGGQWAPVSFGLPTTKVSAITVGGAAS
jgi:TldD protein